MRIFFLQQVLDIFESYVASKCTSYDASNGEKVAVILWTFPVFQYVSIFSAAYQDPSLFNYCLASGLLIGQFFVWGLSELIPDELSGGSCGDFNSGRACEECVMMFFVLVYTIGFELALWSERSRERQQHQSTQHKGKASSDELVRMLQHRYTPGNASSAVNMPFPLRARKTVMQFMHPSRVLNVVLLAVLSILASMASVQLGIFNTKQVAIGAAFGVVWAGLWNIVVYIAVTPNFHHRFVQSLLRLTRMNTFSFRRIEPTITAD